MTESPAEVWTNACIATMDGPEPFGLMTDGAVALGNERIHWVGKRSELPPPYDRWPDKDLHGKLVTPGLIDCHTHLVHGGNRAREFEMRLMGSSYAQIAREGGGIMATVRATRAGNGGKPVQVGPAAPRCTHCRRRHDSGDQVGLRYGF